MEETRRTIKKFKRRKAAGPDEVPIELFKEMDDDMLDVIGEILNEWWRTESIQAEILKARVVMIFKKGSTSKLENYRPISLLNAIYSIFAVIVQDQLAEKLDRHLQKMHFGFRKNKSTADAIQCIRRIAEHGEQTCTRTIMLLLDWEKAFDKVTREGLKSALERTNVYPKIRRSIQEIYRDPTFMVEVDGITSKLYKQATRIRQGCPLSPYLFLVVMTVMFDDIHKDDKQNLIKHRMQGTNYDEVLYADDTICVSTNTMALNKLLASIEEEANKYGLTLNKTKCEVMYNSTKANVHFRDGTEVPRKKGSKVSRMQHQCGRECG
jgi:hypothetical protein